MLHRGGRRRAVRWGVAACVVAGATVGWPTAVPDPVVPPASGAAPRVEQYPARPFAAVANLAWERELPGVMIRESSPVLADLGRPAIVVGALDAKVYAFDVADGATVPGWPAVANAPINSSPAAADVSGTGSDEVFIGAGTADGGQCSGGGVFSYGPTGTVLWARAGFDPNCMSAREPFHSSPTIGNTVGDGTPKLVIGALGLNDWSLNAAGGGIVRGWPIYTDDTSFSTAALANIVGEAAPVAIIGGDASPGGPEVDAALGMPPNWRGGLVRAVNGAGKVLWQFFTDDMVRSSPAVGDISGNGQPSVVFGTGNYWYHQPGGAHDSTKVFALSLDGRLRWSRDLRGVTMGSPALADVGGNGVADAVIGTAEGPDPGKVWVLDGNGNPLPHWAGHESGGGEVIGGITAADLTGDGAQDLLVPTGRGVFAYDGRSGKQLFVLGHDRVVVQGSPLVTQDAPGLLGITVAGTTVFGQGVVEHWTVQVRAPAIGPLSWPMFHHDARHTGNLLEPPLTAAPCEVSGGGYWLVARDGGVFGFCDAPYEGSGVGAAHAPIVAMAPVPASAGAPGYWLVSATGGVYTFGAARFYGAVGRPPASPVVAAAATPSGHGYWLAAADGGVFAFGDAPFLGSAGGAPLNSPVTGIAATPSGRGYWLVAADGGVFAYGDAAFLGAAHSRATAVGIVPTPSGRGYWVVSADGGVFAFGDAPFLGSAAGSHLGAWVIGMAPTHSGRGYWLVAVDGGVFSFGDAPFLGSAVGIDAKEPVVGMAPS
ncbi:MAG TPA: VCBS repeat-containing protein [Acidimicrobiales bacterium]|nr:VCBS repeat-containing protein [Acidimicrobiales bacterium]